MASYDGSTIVALAKFCLRTFCFFYVVIPPQNFLLIQCVYLDLLFLGPGFFSTSRVFFSTSYLFFNLRCLFFNLRGSVFISTSFFLFFQPHMSFFGPHISSHVFFSTSHIFFSTSHVFLSTLYVSLSTCNVSFPSPLDWFLFGMLSVLWVNVGFLWSAF